MSENKAPRPKHVPQPLSRDQIDMAKTIIKENHPLNETPFYVAFPWFRPCASWFPSYRRERGVEEPLLEDHQDRRSTSTHTHKRKKEAKKVNVDQKELERDPFLLLGFGMIAYRNLLQTFIIVFTILSLLMLPALVYYKHHDAILTPVGFQKYSLGNMGYSSSQCTNIPLSVGKLPALCPYGEMGKIYSYGINPTYTKKRALCKVIDVNSECSNYIAKDFGNYLDGLCLNQRNCAIDVTAKRLFDPLRPPSDACKDDDAVFFMQYSCIQPEKVLTEKYKQASVITAMSIFMCFVFLTVIFYLKRANRLQQIEWDVATITPGDYTIEYDIDDDAYSWFLEHVYHQTDQARGLSVGESLKQYLKREFETLLTNQHRQNQSSRTDQEHTGHRQMSEVKIVDIVFAFNNSELINLLKERGLKIMYQRFDDMREVEQRISNLKNSQYSVLTKPVCAFITFEEEDAYLLACEMTVHRNWRGQRKPSKFQLLNQDLYVKPSTEPTNIIWENRHLRPQDRFKRSMRVLLIVMILIAVSFSMIFICKSYSLKVAKKYPPIECAVLDGAYGKNLQKYATNEYKDYYYVPEGEEGVPLTGTLQCFCERQRKAGDDISDKEYILVDDKGSSEGQEPIKLCRQYYIDIYKSLLTNNLVSYLLIIINYTLRLFIIKLIMYIGMDTESAQTKLITDGVFVVQFFNTALLLLLVNANLGEQSPFLGFFFSRSYYDFNSSWFNDIGWTIVYAMLFNVFWPLIEFVSFYNMRACFRIKDRGFNSNDTYKTQKTTLQQYIEIYSGPVYFIHYKYSAILNVVFVTFMYGLGLPILFPVAVFAFLVLYLVEKVMIYYSYRQPPMYDEKLNASVLNRLTYAPLLFFAFGYWFFSSKQLLHNDVQYIESDLNPTPSGHHWTEVFHKEAYKVSPAMPFLVLFWILLVITFFRDTLFRILARAMPQLIKVGHIEVDEDLDNYYNTLDDQDRNWSIKEEENARSSLKLKALFDETLEKLKTTRLGKDHMQGVHTYDILANPLYTDDFQYFSPAIENRKRYIIDDDEDEENDEAQSDLVKMILSLAFMTEDRAAHFTFSKEAYSSALKGLIGGKLGNFSLNKQNNVE